MVSLYCIWLHAQCLCYCFSQIHKSLNVIVKYGPVKSLLRDPSLEENTSFFLKWFCCYLGVYLLQPGYILSANKLAPFPGTRMSISALGERQSWRKISVGKQEFWKVKKVVYLPWRLHCEVFQNLKKKFWLREDTHEVTLIPKYWKVLKIQKSCLREKIKKS